MVDFLNDKFKASANCSNWCHGIWIHAESRSYRPDKNPKNKVRNPSCAPVPT